MTLSEITLKKNIQEEKIHTIIELDYEASIFKDFLLTKNARQIVALKELVYNG